MSSRNSCGCPGHKEGTQTGGCGASFQRVAQGQGGPAWGHGAGAYRLQEAVQLQGLAEQPPPPPDLGHKLVAQVPELVALGADGVHGIVLVVNELLALQGQGAGPLHGCLQREPQRAAQEVPIRASRLRCPTGSVGERVGEGGGGSWGVRVWDSRGGRPG